MDDLEAPFTASLIGSWRFLRCTEVDSELSIKYHFAETGRNYWEFLNDEGKAEVTSIEFSQVSNVLMWHYPNSRWMAELFYAEGDSVRLRRIDGNQWWMERFEPCPNTSLGFINSAGDFAFFQTWPEPFRFLNQLLAVCSGCSQ